MKAIRVERVLPILLTVMAVLAWAPPVDAATGRFHDPRGDSTYCTWIDDDCSDGSWGMDIKSAVIEYHPRSLTVRVHFYALRKYSWEDLYVWFDSGDDNNGADFRFQVGDDNGVYRGRFNYHQLCGLRQSIDYKNDVIRMRAPTSCFGHAPRLRARVEIDDSYQNVEGSDCCDDDTWDAMPGLRGWLDYVHRG